METTVLLVDDQEIVRDVARLALEGDGFRVLEASSCRRWMADLPVLYTSGYADAALGGAFLQKPFSPSQLVEKVKSLLPAR